MQCAKHSATTILCSTPIYYFGIILLYPRISISEVIIIYNYTAAVFKKKKVELIFISRADSNNQALYRESVG